MYSLKEAAIRDYLSNIDFKKDKWSYRNITEEMHKFLGETPGFDVSYEKDVIVNEVTGKSREYEKITSVSIVFTDTDDKMKRLKILID